MRNVLTNPRNLVSFSVLFGICQNLGGLMGAALLGTFQSVREKFHSSRIVEHLTLLDPRVAARVQSGGSAYGSVIADPQLQHLMGIRSLATAATREANVMAYNDVFMLIAIIAMLTMLWIFSRSLWLRCTTLKAAASAAPSVQPSGALPS